METIRRPDDGDTEESFARIRLLFERGSPSVEFTVPLNKIESIKWFEKDMRCRINPKLSSTKANRYLSDVVRLALQNKTPEMRHCVRRLGTHIINGIPFYNCGDRIISPVPIKENWPIVIPEVSSYRLDIDPELSETDMRGKQVVQGSPTCGVIFTGEYIIGVGSDAARLLPVKSSPVDNEKLKKFQDHPLIVSTFYDGFIRWYISNYSCQRQ